MGLESVEIVLTVEDRFCVSIPDAECEKCIAVADLAEAVIRQLPPLQPIGLDANAEFRAYRSRVLTELCQIIAEQTGLPVDTIKPESRFVQDLGID